MLAGASLGWFVLIPLISYVGQALPVPLAPATELISAMTPEAIHKEYIRYIGAGAVAFGGFVSLTKALPTILESVRLAFREMKPSHAEPTVKKRTATDIPFKYVLGGWAIMFVLIGLNRVLSLTNYGVPGGLASHVGIGLLLAFLAMFFSFFFVTVSSRIVGLVGTTSMPLSGMTIGALLITCGVVKAVGLTGGAGMAAAIAVASMVCISISIGGDISQDLKIGFLVGATPKWVQITQLLSVMTSASLICLTVQALAPQVLDGRLQAPQSHIFLLITKGVISGNLPWIPVIIGMGIGACAEMMSIPSLPFAVGLYLPFSLSSTLMFGAIINYFFTRTTPSRLLKPLYEQGLLLCSGMVAGDALVGVFLCGLATKEWDQIIPDHFKGLWFTQEPLVALACFIGLSAFLVKQLLNSRKAIYEETLAE